MRAVALVLALAASPVSTAGEAEIVDRLREALQATDEAQRAELAAAIEADPAFDATPLETWLHRAGSWPEVAAGLRTLEVAVESGLEREVLVRIPDGYTPVRGWPLILAFHAGGQDATWAVRWLESLLGDEIERFVVAAPHHYRQTGLDAPPPFTGEHPRVLRAVRAAVHVDSDRVYAIGYSLGGYASWHLAMVHGDRLAGAIAIASTASVPPCEDGLWEIVKPNLAATPLLAIWGGCDTLATAGLGGTPCGTIAAANRRVRASLEGSGLPITLREIKSAGHAEVRPPRRWLLEALARRRSASPDAVEHRFRHLDQGRAGWVEATAWAGPAWGAGPPAPELLGMLKARRGEGRIEIETRRVAELIVWLEATPVALRIDGQELTPPEVEPSLALAVAEAACELDFDRPRRAGLRVAIVDGGPIRSGAARPRPCPW